MSIEQLRDEILAKKPVIHTRFAEQFVTEPHDVESAYNQHYHTHVPLGDTSDFAKRLVERVSTARTPKGAAVAPWGYGKTSTLIFTWKVCEEAGILTVPPFICSSLQDMLNATYGWLRFRLGSDYHGELESVYGQYGRAAFEERVESYAAQTGVTEADARIVLQTAMADGSFTPELTPINLMKFLEYGTELAGRAGFKGLVILADELQEFFGKSADVRGTIQRLREVVWWLAAHGNLPLGIVLCMPDGTESIIQEDGQDVLDRLKTDRLYVSLGNIYNPAFPRQLWERYVEIYEADAQADQVLDQHVLTATGQIATRKDLGRGPRTVIDVFQCALRHHDKTGETYSPLALIDDFLTGQISFDMQANPIRFAVEDALSLLKNQITTDAHRRAIKLWAAFPEHGCPDEVLDAYEAKEAAYELSEMHGVHGPLLTYQSVGYTLRKLASFTPGGTSVERIARDFWLVYKEQDRKWAEAAQTAFIEHVLPRIFEKRRNAWGSWDLSLTTAKGYAGRLTGTFSDQYPGRVLDIQVATEPTRIEPRQTDTRSDFQFDFVLRPRQGSEVGRDPGRIEYVASNPRWIRFDLNLGNRSLAGANLPQDLRNLKSSIHPNFLTPLLMLAFVDYAERWESLKSDNRILESERGPVNAIVESMINYSVRVLFSEELKATFGQKLNFTGIQIIREIFVLACQAAWPPDTYHPLLTISDRAFGDYLDALTKLPLREKRGDVPLSERQKGKLARLFGIDSHKTFENRAKSDYADLMEYRDLGGDQAQVQLQFHPLEAAVLREMTEGGRIHRIGEREVPALEGSRLLTLADASGYRDEESAMALKLLVARELVGKDDRAGVIYRIPAGPPAPEVDRRLKVLHIHIHGLPAGLLVDREKDPLVRRVEGLRDRFSPELEEEALEEMAIEIGRVEADVTALVNRKRQSLLDGLAEHVQDVQQLLGGLNRATELEEDVPVGLDFRRHLMDLQEALRGKRRKLTGDLNKVHQQLKDLHDRVASGLEMAALPNLYQEYARADSRVRQLIEQGDQLDQERKGLIAWFKLLKESDQLYKSLVTMPDLRARLTDEVVREIMRNFTRRFAQHELAALAGDAELFRDQFDEIARERDSRVAAGHEAFGEVKERYRQWLATMGLERSDFSARYSQVEHELSYQDMFQQVRSLAISHLDHLAERFDSIDLDLRKARKIHLQKLNDAERATLTDLEKRRTELQRDLAKAREWLRTTDLAQAGDLDEQAEAIAEAGREMEKVGQDIRKLMRQIPPQTPEEQKVMALLRERREADLTELVLSAGEEFDLSALVAGLVGLYQGNQIRIKVQRWG
jgi:hypothetical protein